MSKKLIGILAGVTLFGTGAAFANEGHATQDQQATESQSQETLPTGQESGIGGAGEEGTAPEAWPEESARPADKAGIGGSGQEQEVTGKVVKAKSNKVFIEHMGAVLELKTDSKTQFEGDVKKAGDLKEGDEIRASFNVKNKTENQATSISRSSPGTGGSGFEDLGTSDPGSLDNTGADEPSSEPGTGGSGLEGSGIESGTPDTMGTEPAPQQPVESSPDTSGQPLDESSSGTQVR
ncbi:MAG: hypothetical protein M3Y59_25905 [Myxococcota bacterium]|nr:hypothetical protein [Myxococcota bacterium]